MTTKQLKKIIKTRFGSMTKFATLAKVERYELQKFFAAAEKKMTPERAKRIVELANIAKKTKVAPTDSELTPALREKIRVAIFDNYEGVTAFTQLNKLNVTSVFHILEGRRKTISATVKKMIKILNIQHP